MSKKTVIEILSEFMSEEKAERLTNAIIQAVKDDLMEEERVIWENYYGSNFKK